MIDAIKGKSTSLKPDGSTNPNLNSYKNESSSYNNLRKHQG